MQLDYSIAMSHFDGENPADRAFPVGDAHDSASEEEEDLEEPEDDAWSFEENRPVRIHRIPRQKFFLPLSTTAAPPCDISRLTRRRVTATRLGDGTVRTHEDDWWSQTRPVAMDGSWTGQTVFWMEGRSMRQEKPDLNINHNHGAKTGKAQSKKSWSKRRRTIGGIEFTIPPSPSITRWNRVSSTTTSLRRHTSARATGWQIEPWNRSMQQEKDLNSNHNHGIIEH